MLSIPRTISRTVSVTSAIDHSTSRLQKAAV
jgi:hypothetical protein